MLPPQSQLSLPMPSKATLKEDAWPLAARSLASVVGTAWLFMTLPKGFIPNEDTGQVFAFTEAAQGTSFAQMTKLQQQASALGR